MDEQSDTETEIKIRVLTGMPSLEELYVASCVTHYQHFVNMLEKGIGGLSGSPHSRATEILRYSSRTKRLLYVGRVLPGRVSPLQLLVQNTNAIGPENYNKISPSVEDSLLVQLECENASKLNNLDVRTTQRLMSLAYFGKLNIGEQKPKRVCDDDFDIFEKHSTHFSHELRNFRKRARRDFIRQAESNPRGLRFSKNSK